jgi:hypothetical protein
MYVLSAGANVPNMQGFRNLLMLVTRESTGWLLCDTLETLTERTGPLCLMSGYLSSFLVRSYAPRFAALTLSARSLC